ncbi:tyrosine recombinase [Ralstonia phage UAM5]|nr:tyrosine recombinase [Ralstonia phage UAM5]
MGSITPRKNKDGTTTYKVQVRIKRKGVVVHQETETFAKEAVARAWMKKRETALAEPGALAALSAPDPTLGKIIERFLDEVDERRGLGRTQESTLRAIARSELGQSKGSVITSASLVDYARERLENDGVLPQTVNGDLALLGTVFDLARPAWGFPLDASAIEDARRVCRHMGLTERPEERTRRPTRDEMEKLMQHFHEAIRRRAYIVPMIKIAPFAIFSCRRQEEIVKLRWDDINADEQTILVRDMKHPTKKKGNDVWCHLPDRAWRLLHSMPQIEERIFPYTTDAVSAAFLRACNWLGIEDLRFHDLRREGVSHLFELGNDIPQVTRVSAHRNWNVLRRYTNLKGTGDLYAGWKWLDIAIDIEPAQPRRRGIELKARGPSDNSAALAAQATARRERRQRAI